MKDMYLSNRIEIKPEDIEIKDGKVIIKNDMLVRRLDLKSLSPIDMTDSMMVIQWII